MSNLPEQPAINPNQFQVSTKKIQDKQKRGILFLEWGIFEVVFVLVLLCVVFGALNFFNILNVSNVFPQLSFLPHLSSSKQQVSTKIQVTRDPQSQEIVDYIKSTLKPAYWSYNIDTPLFTVTKTKNYYESDWNTANGTASAVLSINPNTHQSIRLYLSFGPIQVGDISSSSAQNAAQTYLNQPNPNFSCGQSKSISYCEDFVSNSYSKSGFGIVKNLKIQGIDIFTCKLFTQNNKTLQRIESCVAQ